MVREIIKDPNILTQQSTPIDFTTERDALENLLQDMLDTANFHKANCAGLAAIQIGIPKRVILVRQDNQFVPYINPTIIKRSPGIYYTMEGCLSLEGARNVKRHRSVMVSYTTRNGNKHVKQFDGYTAQILQHEIDHLNGILI